MVKLAERTKFKIKIEFLESGITLQDEVVAISCAFALNSLPVANATIACGKNVKTNEPSKIHGALEQFIIREAVRISLYVDAERVDGGDEIVGIYGMNKNWSVIFEGYYAGVGYQRAYNSANYTLQFFHWLDDLACSSALNGSWHPGVPHDLAQAAETDHALGGGGGGFSSFIPLADPQRQIITPPNIKKDLWEEVIKKLYENLACRELGEQLGGPSNCDDVNKANNAAAKKALEKIPGEAPEKSKLALKIDGLNDDTLEWAAITAISKIIANNISYSSFWSKLIGEFATEFMFAVSPAATYANVIPYFGGLNKEWVVLKAEEYSYSSFSHTLSTFLNSIEIRFSQSNTSSVWPSGGVTPSVSYYRPLARYPAEPEARGQVVVKEPPLWVSNTIPSALYGPLSTGIQKKPSDSAEGDDSTPGATKKPAETEQDLHGSEIVQNYAEHWYKTEILNQRRGELSGKLRFDIAPGSIVKIETPAEKIDLEPEEKYGVVVQVSFIIDAQKNQAGTSFALSNLRTTTENANPLLTAEKPPLYEEAWRGGPLVKEANP